MRPTEKALVALTLGHKLAMFADSAFAEDYVEDLPQMRKDLAAIGVEGTLLPATAEEFRERQFDAFQAGAAALKENRANLGGDVYALPFFFLSFMLYRAVRSSALGIEWEDERALISGALSDLNLEAEETQVQGLIQRETLWIQSEKVHAADIVRAWGRLLYRVLELWQKARAHAAQDLPPIGIDYVPLYSCFISYSFADEAFCKKLYERLKLAGIQVWFASHDMKGGEKIRDQVRGAIGTYDKLLLVLSAASISSNWVNDELYTAFRREKNEGNQVLFPIRIASFEALRQWQAFDADTGRDLAREVREYFIPDFSDWANKEKFDKAISQLLDSLRRSEQKGDPPRLQREGGDVRPSGESQT
jgi:hypothetical protein